MTRTKTTHHRRKTTRRVTPIVVRMKSSFFEEVLEEVMVRVYGEDMGGFSFESNTKQSLKDISDNNNNNRK